MKLPREVPPASFSALGLVCSSKTMARRESRKYSSTMSSSLYVGSVLKVLLDHHRSTYPKQSVGLSAQLSSCDELPRPTDSSSRCSWLVLHLPAQERLAGRGITMGKQTAVGCVGAASRWACSPELERSAPGIWACAGAPVFQLGVTEARAEGGKKNQGCTLRLSLPLRLSIVSSSIKV